MEKLKEGLKSYLVKQEIQNTYFLSMEYEMIHQNQLESFLSMQLRQENGENDLLYDITGSISLAEIAEGGIDFLFCERLINAIGAVFAQSEEYMLQMEHISFKKEAVYIKNDKEIRFLYCPDEKFFIEQDVEELMAWLLSKLDYEDKQGVEFIYYAYHAIRKKGISKKKIDQILQKADEIKKRSKNPVILDEWPDASENTMPENSDSIEKQEMVPKREKEIQRDKIPAFIDPYEGEENRDRILRIAQKYISLLGCVFGVIGAVHFFLLGWKYGFSNAVCRYILGGIFLFIICIVLQIQVRKREKKLKIKI